MHTYPSIDTARSAAYTVPTDTPEADGTAAWTSTTIVVVRLTCDGVVGTGWTYGPPGCASLAGKLLDDAVVGADPMGVVDIWQSMVRTARNATRAGAIGYAISAIDVAAWDLKARLLQLPLPDLCGSVRRQVPVYGSGGFTTYSEAQLTSQLAYWTRAQQIPRVKIKIGQDRGTDTDRDRARIHQARQVIGPDAELYVDANGAYSAKQAVRLMRSCAQDDVSWFEEPVSSDNLSGLREVRSLVEADVAAGEYCTDIGYARRMCAADAVDCLQIDATRVGGYTEWLRCAAVAAAFELEVSGHCAPNLHAPVAAATPNLRHLEWFHDHVRIESDLFTGALDPTGGSVTPDRARAGHGLTFDDDAAARYAVAP